MLFKIVPEQIISRLNESELVVYFKNGSILQLKGADDPDALRGPNPVGVVLDEFAKMKYEAWGVIEPILRANDGWCWFVGTPKGKNHLFNHYQRGKEDHHEWYSMLLKASTSGIIAPDQLAESRKSMSQALYNQEWECEFLEGEGQVFRGVREVLTATPEKPMQDHLYVIGCDLAKVQDYTVLTVYDRKTNAQVYQDRFQTIEWPFQKKRIAALSKHYNNAVVVLDSTGLGDPIADDLARALVPVKAFKITEPSKKDLIEKLSIWIEQHQIQMLNIEQTLFEFDNFSYEIGSTGRIRYGAPEGFHDDIVISHALAISELQPLFNSTYAKPKTPIQKELERRKKELAQQDQYVEDVEWGEFVA